MKTIVRIVALGCVVTGCSGIASAQAPPVDIEFFYVWSSDPGGGDSGNRLDYVGSSLGGGFNFRWANAFSTRVSAWQSSASLRLADQGPGVVGGIDVVPLAVTVQWHPLGRNWIDPYVGVGAAVLFPSSSFVFGSGGPGQVLQVIPDTEVTFAAEAGFRIRVVGALGLLVDARYLPASLGATLLVEEPPGDLEVVLDADLLAVTAGLSLRF